jgi:uncharacterized protein (TIGR02217 family)
MSNAIFPTVAGLGWSIHKVPLFKTAISEARSGKEVRSAAMAQPRYRIELAYSYLKNDGVIGAGNSDDDLRTILGFFLARQGSFDSFLWTHPYDNTVTSQNLGTGNGSLTQFQFFRSIGGFNETIQNVNQITSLTVGGAAKTQGVDFSVSSSGTITFTSAPTNGAGIVASFTFYYRVRFADDQLDFENFMYKLYELKKCEFVTEKV